MATSGSFTGTTSNEYITPKIEWSAQQNISGNYSNVTAKLFYKKSSSSTEATTGTLKATITINGTTSDTVSQRITMKCNNTYQQVMSFTVKVPHNDDGSKTITIKCSGYISGTSLDSTTCSKSVDLTTINRKSTVSATSADIGSILTINIKSAATRFTHTLSYSFGTLSGTIASKTSDTSVDWTLPTTFYNQMSSSKSKTGTITCETFNGSDSLGTSTCSFTANISNENAPTLNPKVYVSNTSDTYKLTGSTTKLIRHYTWASYEINAIAKNGATITSQSMTNGGNTYTESSRQMDKAIVSGDFLFKATDSRGFTSQQTLKVDVVDYIRPSCVVQADIGSDGTLTVSITGQFFNGSFGVVDNSLQVAYKYKESGGTYSEWYFITPAISGNTYKATGVSKNLDYTKSYSIQAWAGDALYEYNLSEGVYTDPVSVKSYPLFDWGENDFKFNTHVNFGETTSLFPVGSVYHTSTNINPSSYLGGTWKQINKMLHATRSSDAATIFTHNTSVVSSMGNSTVIIQSNCIRVRLNMVLATNLTDDSFTLGTLNFSHLGITGLVYTQYITGYTDGGNAISQAMVNHESGVITNVDIVPKADGNSIASGQTLVLDFVIVPENDYLLESACDDFVWKRTA